MVAAKRKPEELSPRSVKGEPLTERGAMERGVPGKANSVAKAGEGGSKVKLKGLLQLESGQQDK